MDKHRLQIQDLITSLSFQKKLVFAVLVCEKLYPNYVYFSNKNDWVNSEVLENAISNLYQYIYRSDLFSESEIEALIDEINQITPNTEDFEEIFVSFALDACTSILSTLNFILDKNTENIIDVATNATDTVDMFIQ